MRKVILVALLLSAVITSGCVSGQTLKRQAAEQQFVTDYEPEPKDIVIQPETEVETAETPPAQPCNESWECAGWSGCMNGSQFRLCADRCLSNADCPPESECKRYFCEGSPKACTPYVTVPCCGDGICDSGEACGRDCAQGADQPETPQASPTQHAPEPPAAPNAPKPVITNVNFKAPEFAEISNQGDAPQDMAGWTLEDSSPETAGHRYTFPSFSLAPGASVRVNTDSGADSSTELFWNRNCSQNSFQCIWNDKGDVATLRDAAGNVISTFSYPK